MTQPIIIGGGVAGLTAALHLAERGVKPLVLEADATWIGGRLSSGPTVEIEHQGQVWRFTGEHGVHGVWSPYRNLKAMLARHEIDPGFIAAQEETWIHSNGRRIKRSAVGSGIRGSWVPAPFHYLQLFLRPRFLNMLTLRDIAAMFRLFGSLISALAIDPLEEQKSLTGMSLADFMAGWSPTLQNFMAGLARNALAAHPEEVPASGFIAFLRFYTLMRRDAWAFEYMPASGGRCIAEPLAQRVTALGGEIRQGQRVISLRRGENSYRWRLVLEDDSTLEADDVILAIDSPGAKQLLTKSPPTAGEAMRMVFPTGIPTAIIRLWFKQQPKNVSEAGIFTGDFVVDNFFWLDRLQTEYQTWRQATGGSAIEMHIYGPPELLARPDAALLAQILLDLYRTFPELRGSLLHSEFLRNEATHTLFSVAEPGQHLGIESPWPGLYACGDWVYHPTPALYLERATTTGIAAANAFLQAHEQPTWHVLPHPTPEWLAGVMARRLQGWRQAAVARRSQK